LAQFFLEKGTNTLEKMPTIHLTTFIAAPIERVFDLARSIDLHKKSFSQHKEEAVSGVTTGLINLNDTVTWKARHLGKTRFFKSRITALDRPSLFTDEMAEGDFKAYLHEHHFKQVENGAIMIDIIKFEAPYGVVGRLFSKVYLAGYLRKMLEHRNKMIREYAETDKWKGLI
jgi:ligand-binding SRPBCC domain-containing protein